MKNTEIKKINYYGQILIVMMLVLAIISILLVIIARNVQRDTLDQIQTDQYEEYYSAVEEQLRRIITGDSDCDLSTNTTCVVELETLANYNVLRSSELVITKEDSVTFNDLIVDKDKSITIDLDGYKDNLSFSWKGDVAWVVSLDYTDSVGQYKTSTSIYDGSTTGIFPERASFTNCINFTNTTENSFSFSIDQCLNSAEPSLNYQTVAVRMKPVMLSAANTELTLVSAGAGLPPQARIILATAEIDDDLGNSPVIQLELLLPLTNPTVEILDYALRTEDSVIKPQ